ncbi:hypothetical protein RUM43_000494 [Polyplax serrata]|uniref:Uncharacterized protein n=1 Tax=Polyplax serrata TaxID=468196 RepID=A0AAN8SG47_POLSC
MVRSDEMLYKSDIFRIAESISDLKYEAFQEDYTGRTVEKAARGIGNEDINKTLPFYSTTPDLLNKCPEAKPSSRAREATFCRGQNPRGTNVSDVRMTRRFADYKWRKQKF